MVLREQEEDEDDEEEEGDDEEEEGDDDEEDEEEEAIRRAPGAQPKAIDEYRFIKGKMRHQMLKVSIGGYLVTKRRLVQLLEREEILVATRHQVTELEKYLGNARASRVIPLGPLEKQAIIAALAATGPAETLQFQSALFALLYSGSRAKDTDVLTPTNVLNQARTTGQLILNASRKLLKQGGTFSVMFDGAGHLGNLLALFIHPETNEPESLFIGTLQPDGGTGLAGRNAIFNARNKKSN